MNDLAGYLVNLIQKGVQLWVENGELRFRAAKGVLTPLLRAGLVERKADIIAFLEPLGKFSPTSYAQQRLWILDQLEPGSVAYNMPLAYRLHGLLDVDALAWGLRAIVERHETLRTRFITLAGEPVQVIVPLMEVSVPIKDLSGFPENEREAETQRLVMDESRKPFDLARGPLFRANLLRLEDEEHILFLNMHHIVSDGWSLGVFNRELRALYEAYLAGQPSPLLPLPVQYTDFAVWQREWLQGEALDDQLGYWKQQLSGHPPILELPTDFPRPPVQTYEGAYRTLELTPALSQQLRMFDQQEGVTMFMALLTAFQVLLHRYSGQEDIVVGTPIANRNQAKIEGLIGFFVNTLVMRADLSGKPSFREALHRMQEAALESYAHQDLPFEKLVEELQPARDLSRSPIFQVFFNMINLSRDELTLPGLGIEPVALSEAQAKFDLTLYASDNGESVGLSLLYNTNLFTAERIEELLRQFQVLLAQIVENPDEAIDRYSLVTPIAQTWLPSPTAELAREWCVSMPERFSQQAGRVGSHLAVIDPQESWTYAELDARSNQLAHYLREHGIQSQDVVAVYAHRSASLVWALLGVLKAGAAFVILDADYPARRLADCLEIAAPKGWLQITAAGELPEKLEEAVAGIPFRLNLPPRSLIESQGALQGYPTEAPNVTVKPDDLAYVAFTSGTTGKPRGIRGSHRPLSHFLEWHTATFGLHESDHFSMLSGLAHDPLLRDIFTPLWLGANLYIPEASREEMGDHLLQWAQQNKITIMHLTPALGQLLMAAGTTETLPTLRYAFFGGDVLTRSDVERLIEFAPAAQCINFYGATETPQAMGYYVVGPDAPGKATIPLGSGIRDTQLLVLNTEQRLAGVGELGEIYIRTPYLSLGYVGNETDTHRRFISNPFTGRLDDRIYRTGDLARYLPDGNIEFIGRMDGQVKLRGFRIELGEIEAALSQHPAVREALAMMREDRPGDKYLAAYLVPHDRQELPTSEMRGFLKNSLPDYMIPATFVTLQAFPLTPNGKIDRQALPAPEGGSIVGGEAFVAPHTPIEELLAGIWSEILGCQRVGALDNFFELGGHSLSATRVLSRIRAVFEVNMPLRSLFEMPTVAELARRIEQTITGSLERPVLAIRRAARASKLLLSFTQQRLWFLEQLNAGQATYNSRLALRLTGLLDVPALEQSLNEIVRRHESLRTTFTVMDGQPIQIVGPAINLPLPIIGLEKLPQAEREAEAMRRVIEETQRPFDLSYGPLLVRASLLRLGDTEHILVLVIHHIAFDGWSMGILTGELTAHYSAFSAGQPSPLPELPIQYADFAAWQREWLQGEVLERQLAYWKQQIGDHLPVLELPTDRPRPAVNTFRGATYTFTFPLPLTEALKSLSQRERATLFMTLLTAFKALLYRYTGQVNIMVASLIANRNHAEIEGLIGCFINTLALCTNLAGNPSFRELLTREREVILGAYTNQDMPVEKLMEDLLPERNLSQNPLFQVLFVLQNAPTKRLELPNLYLTPIDIERQETDLDLSLYMVETEEGLVGCLAYNTDLFDADRMIRLARHYQTLLEGVVSDPGQRLADLPLLTDAERHQILVEWNNTQAEYPTNRCIHELFEEQVRRTPDAVAVMFENERLTYRELNARANQLAHYLQKQGVEPDTPVGICAERSLEMIVGLLGILKAGGAYVPLDPTYPKERLAFMQTDSQTTLLLTQSALRDRLPGGNYRHVCLDTDWRLIAQEAESEAASAVTAQHLAYIIYTSGSTDRPKGVMVQHNSVVNYIEAAVAEFGLQCGDGVLQFASISFDAAVEEIFTSLASGAMLVLRTDAMLLSASTFLQTCREWGVTVLDLPTAYWHLLTADLAREGTSLPPKLRLVIIGGERALPERLTTWREQFGSSVMLLNTYGPTEATVVATMCNLAGPDGVVEAQHEAPIGRAVRNAQAYLLDQHAQPAPLGVPGELCIGGVGVARGYLNRPDLTAERFVPNPFGAEPGARLYRTGDLARWLPNGNLEFLGRIDHQVKVRGYRIELGEIEAALGQHPAVRECVVVAREDVPGDSRLVAYIVPLEGQMPEASALRSFLKGKLPEYMLPAAFVLLESLPLTPNRKVDRRALQTMAYISAEPARVFTAPGTPFEEIMAEIFGEVLGREQISVHDDFFEMGGHSLLATQVMSRVRDRFELVLPIRRLFETSTVAGMGQQVEQALIAKIKTMGEDEKEKILNA